MQLIQLHLRLFNQVYTMYYCKWNICRTMVSFTCSSIITTPVCEWCCPEPYCHFIHLVTPTTSWHQWNHFVLCGRTKRDRNRPEMDFYCTWWWPESGIPPPILHIPVWSSSTYCWTWAIQCPISAQDSWNMWGKVTLQLHWTESVLKQVILHISVTIKMISTTANGSCSILFCYSENVNDSLHLQNK